MENLQEYRMENITLDFIKNSLARSEAIYKRGENIFYLGNYSLVNEIAGGGEWEYAIDGSHGEYRVKIQFKGSRIDTKCTCPYPYKGCKHAIAACLDIVHNRLKKISSEGDSGQGLDGKNFMSVEEIRQAALSGRERSAGSEDFTLQRGDTFKGTHTVSNAQGTEYIVTLYDPEAGKGHCTCPDFSTNHLNTCKHLIYVCKKLRKDKDFAAQVKEEKFPFVHLTWDSAQGKPCYYYDRQMTEDTAGHFKDLFDNRGMYRERDISKLYRLSEALRDNGNVKFDPYLMKKINDCLLEKEIAAEKQKFKQDYGFLHNLQLYPYQKTGVEFALFKKAALIADEMGLGKTVQAIAAAILKKKFFGITKVLVITPASLKDQWKKEIEKFTDEKAVIISGTRIARQEIYGSGSEFFKITNYEAVLRDILAISRFSPDLIILDEAQRIKNFETKTHQAINRIPKKQVLAITGTPLENRLEDLYAVMQIIEPGLLSPLWVFAANHYNLHREKKNKILGYKNITQLHDKLQDIIIRRRKEEVLEDLPEQIVNTYYLELSAEQSELHRGYAAAMMPLLNKKFITPMDIKKIQMLLTCMRMVCNSTYLIDKKTNISPKLQELILILQELIIENGRKTVIFSEWTGMTYLIGKTLSNLGIPFIEFTGSIPVEKRQALIDEFNNNPKCKVFLSTDAGGVGLNLQTADCVINFELPWNPAKLNQRIGRVNRLGQKSKTVNVVNLVSKHSIEEKVLAGINLKQELFDAVFTGSADAIDFSRENKTKFLNQIRAMFGEEADLPRGEPALREELETGLPHFLNPEVLKEKEPEVDLSAEETNNEYGNENTALNVNGNEPVLAGNTGTGSEAPGSSAADNNEALEQVMEQGLQFLNGLASLVTGKPMLSGREGKAVTVDRETGEVTLRFKIGNVL